MRASSDERQKRADDEKETGRLEAFSDGVFAIAITLLVLEIHVPPAAKDVWRQWPSFAGYVVSFLTILVMWMNHHTIFDMVSRINRLFLFLNGLLLLVITFINYPTALVATYLNTDGEKFAALFYNGTLIVIALLFNMLWLYASKNGRLLSRSASRSQVQSITAQYRFGPIFYFIAFLLALVGLSMAGLIVDFLLAIFFSLNGIQLQRQSVRSEEHDQF